MAESAATNAEQQLRLGSSKNAVIEANVKSNKVELEAAQADKDSKTTEQQKLEQPLRNSRGYKRQSEEQFTAMTAASREARQEYSNHTNHLRMAERDAGVAAQSAKHAGMRFSKAVADHKTRVDNNKAAMSELLSSEGKFEVADTQATEDLLLNASSLQTLQDVQSELLSASSAHIDKVAVEEQARKAEREAQAASHTSEMELEVAQQKEKESAESHFSAEQALDSARDASSDARAAVSATGDKLVVAEMSVKAAKLEEQRAEEIFDDATKAAEKQRQLIASVVAAASAKE